MIISSKSDSVLHTRCEQVHAQYHMMCEYHKQLNEVRNFDVDTFVRSLCHQSNEHDIEVYKNAIQFMQHRLDYVLESLQKDPPRLL